MAWGHADFFKELTREGLEQVATVTKRSVATTACFADRTDLLQGKEELMAAMSHPTHGKYIFERLLEEAKNFEDTVEIGKKLGQGRRRTACLKKAIGLCQNAEQAEELFELFVSCRIGELYELLRQRKLGFKGSESKPPP